ncbi:MoaD/ThiS family protein [Secundilactobacillus folii]|nr:MoaD/ThiS family protein [Secundilactobacillus folii]
MEIQVKLFAMLQEQLGDSVAVEVPAQPTADQIKGAVGQLAPNVRQMVSTARLAVNQEFAGNGQLKLSAADEVALIPPVSGG